jgi:hypothetical protein
MNRPQVSPPAACAASLSSQPCRRRRRARSQLRRRARPAAPPARPPARRRAQHAAPVARAGRGRQGVNGSGAAPKAAPAAELNDAPPRNEEPQRQTPNAHTPDPPRATLCCVVPAPTARADAPAYGRPAGAPCTRGRPLPPPPRMGRRPRVSGSWMPWVSGWRRRERGRGPQALLPAGMASARSARGGAPAGPSPRSGWSRLTLRPQARRAPYHRRNRPGEGAGSPSAGQGGHRPSWKARFQSGAQSREIKALPPQNRFTAGSATVQPRHDHRELAAIRGARFGRGRPRRTRAPCPPRKPAPAPPACARRAARRRRAPACASGGDAAPRRALPPPPPPLRAGLSGALAHKQCAAPCRQPCRRSWKS